MPTALLPQEETSDAADVQYAVVAVRNPDLRATAETVLRAAGVVPLQAADEHQSIRAVQEHDVVLGIVDAEMLASVRPEQLRRLRQEPLIAGVPILLLSGNGQLDIEAMVRAGITHFASGRMVDEDLTNRVALLLAGSRATRRRRIAAARLREKTRAVSAALRATNDPGQMAALVVQGLGEAFGACSVRMDTFPDERVPKLTASWNRVPEAADLPQVPLPDAVLLCSSLWDRETVLRVEDHLCPGTVEDTILPTGTPPHPRTSVLAPLAHGDQVFGYVWIAGTAGARRWSRTELSLIQHVCGNLAHGLLQGHLITGQREVVTRLRELDQAKTDFVATVNHELRTPLTSITGYLELILDGSGGEVPPHVAQMLDIVGRNAVRLNQLISDLLTISRAEAQTNLPSVEEIDLGELLSSVAAALAPAAAANAITVRLAPAAAPLLVDGDKAQLEQVFTNLLSNAVKFTLPDGYVEVRGVVIRGEAGTRVRVEVADNGIGIPAADIPKLFQRFFRASNAAAAAIPGTGLGLAIVQDIVHRHGGELGIDSAAGRGTTVTVSLPAR
ncbi:ATP-binding protein [Arthrobacter sp. NPDC097144]|uniref:sensor histidine kinase n=1 Tax=Arthrobacter sp. NPDC097144 TaxID=3363946 RepID=UPI0037F774CF